jgi:hypothetical protein
VYDTLYSSTHETKCKVTHVEAKAMQERQRLDLRQRRPPLLLSEARPKDGCRVVALAFLLEMVLTLSVFVMKKKNKREEEKLREFSVGGRGGGVIE